MKEKKSEKMIVMVGMGLFEELPGGANRYMTSFAEAMAIQGNEIAVFIPKLKETPLVGKYPFEIIRYTPTQVKKNFLEKAVGFMQKNRIIRSTFIKEILSKEEDIVINSHFALNVWPLLSILKKKRIPLITHFHGPWALESLVEYPDSLKMKLRAKAAKHIEKTVYQNSEAIITLSEAFKDVLMKEYGIEKNKIYVIPGATVVQKNALELTKREAKERLGLEPETTYILTVRRLVNRMGLRELLTAIKVLGSTKVKFIIGGKGPLLEELKRMATECKAEIFFPGFISEEELPIYYRASDMYILPTQSLEGFGLVTVEAMGYGTPVIATNVGGSSEILPKIAPQLLISPKVDAIRESLQHFIEGTTVVPGSEELIRFVAEEYSWSRVCRDFIRLLDRTV